MFILRMLKNDRLARRTSIIHLVLCTILVSLTIYAWKLSGCPGFEDSSLCLTMPPDFFMSPIPLSSSVDDFSRLMDLSNFTFLINNLACNNSDLVLIVLVHSDPGNFIKRRVIRETWGSTSGEKFKLLFLLGLTNSTRVQKFVEIENEENKDLIQGNFVDTYRNLTYKHVMALKWAKYFCKNARYILKTDDDIFVNLPSFLTYVEAHLPETGLMRCDPVYEGRAHRTSRSKWRVTFAEYKFRVYPTFCQGFAILYSPDVVTTLYSKAQVSRYFWIDDVFITGILASSTNFSPTTFGSLLLNPSDLHSVIGSEEEEFTYLLGPWNLNTNDIIKLWNRVGSGMGKLPTSAVSVSVYGLVQKFNSSY